MINIDDIEFGKSIIWCRLGHIDIDIRIPLYIKNNLLYCIIIDKTDNYDFGKFVSNDIEYFTKFFQLL